MQARNNTKRDDLKNMPKAGDVRTLTSGVTAYLAPLPLPTMHPAIDYSNTLGEVNDTYLEFGAVRTNIYAWQMVIGFPITLSALFLLVLPTSAGAGALLVGGTWFDAKDFFYNTYDGFLVVPVLANIFLFVLYLCVWLNRRNTDDRTIHPRFNRQRREACFVPEGGNKAYFVPWEALYAWTTEKPYRTRGGMLYQYTLSIGFHHKFRGRDHVVEHDHAALPLALSTWEAVRSYMEYELLTLEHIQPKDELHEPGDPPYEGLHTFRNAHRLLHRRYREGEVGVFTLFFWYLSHIVTLWTLPAYAAEYQARLLLRSKPEIPEEMAQWSEPRPKEQWAKASELLKRQSKMVTQIWTNHSQRVPITAIFAEVGRQLGGKDANTNKAAY